MERHEEAARAEQSGDPERAILLYETSVAEGFVGSHPYGLASLHERRRNYEEALRACEAFVLLATSGTMPGRPTLRRPQAPLVPRPHRALPEELLDQP